MKILESFGGVVLLAALFCYFLAFSLIVLGPAVITNANEPEVIDIHGNVVKVPPYTDDEKAGREVYINQVCWHCHSQFVRPVSNESLRYGSVSETWEYQNELQRPVMFGTRRVGPDLSRQGGRHGNDWHAVHFYRPKSVVPESPMPNYPWLFDGSPDKPNRRGLALITYVQWLGSWLESYPYYEELQSIKSEGY